MEWLAIRIASPQLDIKPSIRRPSLMPGIHPEFQVNNIPEGYSSAIMCALACQTPKPLLVDAEHALGVEMVLIGLIAVAWDCRTKGNMGIRYQDVSKHWRETVSEGEPAVGRSC